MGGHTSKPSIEEMRNEASKLDWDSYNEHMQELFNKLDGDHDGFLEADEALQFIHMALSDMAERLHHKPELLMKSLFRTADYRLAQRRFFMYLDSNMDGKISFTEFSEHMHNIVASDDPATTAIGVTLLGEERQALVTSLGEKLHEKLHETLVAGVKEVTPVIIEEVKDELMKDIMPVMQRLRAILESPVLQHNATLVMGLLFILILLPYLAILKYLLSWH